MTRTFETEKNNIPEGATHYYHHVGDDFGYYMLMGDLWKFWSVSMGSWVCVTDNECAYEAHEIPEPKVDEFKPGDKVYIKHTQQQCLLIGNHPEHPCYVVEMPDNEFRVVPLDMISKYPALPTPLNIPWHLLHPKFKFATMDKDGEVDLWGIAPICFDKADEGECWDAPFGIAHETLTDRMEIDKEGINWKQSLTERPKAFPPKEFWQHLDLLFKCNRINGQGKGE